MSESQLPNKTMMIPAGICGPSATYIDMPDVTGGDAGTESSALDGNDGSLMQRSLQPTV